MQFKFHQFTFRARINSFTILWLYLRKGAMMGPQFTSMEGFPFAGLREPLGLNTATQALPLSLFLENREHHLRLHLIKLLQSRRKRRLVVERCIHH